MLLNEFVSFFFLNIIWQEQSSIYGDDEQDSCRHFAIKPGREFIYSSDTFRLK